MAWCTPQVATKRHFVTLYTKVNKCIGCQNLTSWKENGFVGIEAG